MPNANPELFCFRMSLLKPLGKDTPVISELAHKQGV